MKPCYNILFVVGLTAFCAHAHLPPPDTVLMSHNVCELLNILERPILGQDGLPIKDSPIETSFRNVSITLNEEHLKGTFMLTNGMDKTIHLSNNYDPIHQKLYLNSTVKETSFTGLYEIIDGQVNIPNCGQHNFSGKGFLNSSAFDVVISVAVGIKVDPESDELFLTELQLDYGFGNATIIAENLVVDGIPVEWEVVNKNIRPVFDKIWKAAHDFMVNFAQGPIVTALKGCKLSDVTSSVADYATNPEYYDEYY